MSLSHTHKGEGCRLVWPHVWQCAKKLNVRNVLLFLLLLFNLQGLFSQKCVFIYLFIFLTTNTFDRHSWLYQRHATQLPSTLQFEQSVKGKKEINSTLTNVNKVLSGQQQRIDSIKRANVPLACLSFNYITGSLFHILP